MHFDQETGTHYNYYRDFDPNTGRYAQSDPIGLRGGINTYAYGGSNALSNVDALGLEVTLTCRTVGLFGRIGLSSPIHCAVFVWHWETDQSAKCNCSKKKVIDAQYSLAGGGTKPTDDPNNQTYKDDRLAFSNGSSNFVIPVPSGMSQSGFDQATIKSGNGYSQGTYMPPGYGPNSNSAAFNIIRGAGGVPPDVSGAWSRDCPPFGGDPNATAGIP